METPTNCWYEGHPIFISHYNISVVYPMINHEQSKLSWYILYTGDMISGWWFGTCFIFPFSWECHHPNWRTLIFFRGVETSTTNQLLSSHCHPISALNSPSPHHSHRCHGLGSSTAGSPGPPGATGANAAAAASGGAATRLSTLAFNVATSEMEILRIGWKIPKERC